MTIADLITTLTAESVAVFLFFIIIPVIAFLGTMASGQSSNSAPYSYIFSTLIYLVCVPAVLCLIFWFYSMFFEQRSLLQLPFSIYYLPLIAAFLTIFVISRKANIRTLPWFGALYTLLIMIAIVCIFILTIMHLQIIKFRFLWQILLAFVLIFTLLKLGWERFVRLTS